MSEEEIAGAVAVYRDAYCGACHTLTVASTRGTFAPNHDSMGVLAEVRLQDPRYQGAAQTPADYIRESILEPRAYIEDTYQITHHPMPPYSHLSPEAIEAMVTLLLIQREEISGD
jgi:mono/diheme cytochrome c family protein